MIGGEIYWSPYLKIKEIFTTAVILSFVWKLVYEYNWEPQGNVWDDMPKKVRRGAKKVFFLDSD